MNVGKVPNGFQCSFSQDHSDLAVSLSSLVSCLLDHDVTSCTLKHSSKRSATVSGDQLPGLLVISPQYCENNLPYFLDIVDLKRKNGGVAQW